MKPQRDSKGRVLPYKERLNRDVTYSHRQFAKRLAKVQAAGSKVKAVSDTVETKPPENAARRLFATGAERDSTEGKGWFAGVSPIAMRRLAVVLQKGAAKYAPRNWEKGMVLSCFFDSAQRHLWQWANGEKDEDHLGHAFWNVMALIHTEQKIALGELPSTLHDMGGRLD